MKGKSKGNHWSWVQSNKELKITKFKLVHTYTLYTINTDLTAEIQTQTKLF